MAEKGYQPIFSEDVAEFLLQLPKRRQRQVVQLIRDLVAHPYVRSDYSLRDESGRDIQYLMIEDYVFAYWLDHAPRELRIVGIEDAS